MEFLVITDRKESSTEYPQSGSVAPQEVAGGVMRLYNSSRQQSSVRSVGWLTAFHCFHIASCVCRGALGHDSDLTISKNIFSLFSGKQFATHAREIAGYIRELEIAFTGSCCRETRYRTSTLVS